MHLRRTLKHDKQGSTAACRCERSEAISVSDKDCFVADAPRNDMFRLAMPFSRGWCHARLRGHPGLGVRVALLVHSR